MILTASRRRSLGRSYKCVFDVLQVAFGHLLGNREIFRPGRIDRPLNYTQRKFQSFSNHEKRKDKGTIVWPSVFVGKHSRGVRAARAIRARPDPGCGRRRLTACMRELDIDLRPLRVSKVDDPFKRHDLRVREGRAMTCRRAFERRVMRGQRAKGSEIWRRLLL